MIKRKTRASVDHAISFHPYWLMFDLVLLVLWCASAFLGIYLLGLAGQ